MCLDHNTVGYEMWLTHYVSVINTITFQRDYLQNEKMLRFCVNLFLTPILTVFRQCDAFIKNDWQNLFYIILLSNRSFLGKNFFNL